jgi:hypothetical protein
MNEILKAREWAGKSMVFYLTLMVLGHSTIAQQSLPIIHAISNRVDIRDGDVYQKGVWNLSPEINPDVYYCLESESTREVTFYTDIDSISFDVEHNTSYDFLIVLNKTDTCYTRIVGGEPKKRVVRSNLTPKQLQEDFIQLVEALQREHGDLTRYNSKVQLKELCNRLFQKLDHPMDQYEFGTVVSYLISAIQNGHTGSSLPPELMSDYEEQIKMFPVQLWFTDKKALIACDKYEDLPVETEILSINRVPVNEIKNKLFHYMKSDGKIESKKYWVLNYEGFPYLYNWVYGETDEYTIEYKTENGTISSKTLKADFISSSQCLSFDRRVEKNLQFEQLTNDISLLSIRSFHSKELMRTGEDFPGFLENSFREIEDKKVKTLIIDLRNNSGGDDAYGALLYSYLVDRPFQFFPLQDTVSQLQLPGKWSYTGRVIFLINGLSFSTTSNFAAIAKSNDRGEFVGEETAGAYYGGSAGETYMTVLPNSHIRITIPKDPYDNPVKPIKNRDRGVIPNHVVKPTLREIIQNDDVQLNYAFELAGK